MRVAPQIRLLLIAILITGTSPAGSAEGIEGWNYREHSKLAWRSYETVAFEEAKRTHKPVFVLIYSDRCHWCRKYEIETLEQPGIRDLLENQFVPVAVDNDRQKDLGRQLGAKLVPTTLILAPDGTKLLRFYGVQSTTDLADTLAKTLALWRRGELPQPDFGSADTCCPVVDDGAGPDRGRERKDSDRGSSSGSQP